MSFLKVKRSIGDVQEFINEVNQEPRSLRYKSEPNATHRIYVPTKKTVVNIDGKDVVKDEIVAISVPIHRVTTVDGQYRGTYCTKGIVGEDGKMMSCPYCDAVNKAWEEVRYRIKYEDEHCTITDPNARQKYLEDAHKKIYGSLKFNEPMQQVYLLIVQYKIEKNKAVLSEETGLPIFELKVMRLSTNRFESLNTNAVNAANESLGNAEFIIKYDGTEEAKHRKSVDTCVDPRRRWVETTPELLKAINAEVEKFDMNHLASVFSELADVSEEEKRAIVDEQFANWDKFQLELKTNPNAVYLETQPGTPIPTAASTPAPALEVNADTLFNSSFADIAGNIKM